MLMITHLVGFGAAPGGGAAPTSYVFAGSDADAPGNATSVSLNIAWGDEPPAGHTRHHIVGVGTIGSGGVPSSVTVGGDAAILLVGGAGGGRTYSLWIVEKPTGTSGAVVVASSDIDAILAAVWAGYNLQSTTPTDTAVDDDATAGASDLSLNVLDGGAVFFMGTRSGGVADPVFVGVAEDAEAIIGTAFRSWAASAFDVAAASPRTVTATTGAGFQIPAVAASVR